MNKSVNGQRAAGKTVQARLTNKRSSASDTERDLAVSVNGLEELFLATPGISLEAISRAVINEACRLTGSASGFAGYTAATSVRLKAAGPAGKSAKKPSKTGPFASAEFNKLWAGVITGKKPVLSNSVPRGPKLNKFLGVPVLCGGKQLGILALTSPRKDYTAGDLEAARQLARSYGIMLKHKLAEDAERREHDGLLAIIASSQDIIYSADMEGKIVYASPKVAAYGYKLKDIIGRSIFELIHPRDRAIAVKALANAKKTGRPLPMLSYRLRKKDGGYFSMEQKSGIILSGGVPALITGIVRDVGRKLGAAELLKENEATLRSIFDSSLDAIFIKDLSGRYVKLNKACAEVLRVKPEEALGKTDAELFPPEIARELAKDDREVERTGKTMVRTYDRVLPSGKYYFNTVKTPLRNARGKITGVLGVARDITDVKKAEEELAGFRAAEAMSEVARPLAHDFNNALSIINGNATLIDEETKASNPIKPEIGQILNAVKWAAELTSRFQYFARNPKPGAADGVVKA
jgi:PAS domain S-box-containing protein